MQQTPSQSSSATNVPIGPESKGIDRAPSIHLHQAQAPHSWFRPTLASFHYHDHKETCGEHQANGEDSDHPTHVVSYNSRKARKGRYAPKVHHVQDSPQTATSLEPGWVQLRVKGVGSKFKPHLNADISFWIAVFFTVGSIFWVINGFTLLLPIYLTYISGNESLDNTYFLVAAAMAFLGGTTFEVGSYLMVVEAINRGRETNFGPSLEKLLWASKDRRTIKSEGHDDVSTLNGGEMEKGGRVVDQGEKGKFVWWGKGQWHDLGYCAAYIQLWAATVFWISTLTGLPGVIPGYPDSPSLAIVDIFFWTPQVIGGTGFVISSSLLMLEVQKAWYKPALTDIGWHIGFWNLIGSVGFLICGAFGYRESSTYWAKQSTISTFWGGWAFLIGSGIQLYETLWREPESKSAKTVS